MYIPDLCCYTCWLGYQYWKQRADTQMAGFGGRTHWPPQKYWMPPGNATSWNLVMWTLRDFNSNFIMLPSHAAKLSHVSIAAILHPGVEILLHTLQKQPNALVSKQANNYKLRIPCTTNRLATKTQTVFQSEIWMVCEDMFAAERPKEGPFPRLPTNTKSCLDRLACYVEDIPDEAIQTSLILMLDLTWRWLD